MASTGIAFLVTVHRFRNVNAEVMPTRFRAAVLVQYSARRLNFVGPDA